MAEFAEELRAWGVKANVADEAAVRCGSDSPEYKRHETALANAEWAIHDCIAALAFDGEIETVADIIAMLSLARSAAECYLPSEHPATTVFDALTTRALIWLEQRSGVEHVAVVGKRFGDSDLVAAHAAYRPDWYISGRSYNAALGEAETRQHEEFLRLAYLELSDPATLHRAAVIQERTCREYAALVGGGAP
ncbi:MAG: hypothetical protein RIM84_07810 [Alphaproteobacteria bacterium]